VDEKSRTIFFLGVGREKAAILTLSISIAWASTGRTGVADAGERNHEVTLSATRILCRYILDAGDAAGQRIARRLGQAARESGEGGHFEAGRHGWKPAIPSWQKPRRADDIYGLMFKRPISTRRKNIRLSTIFIRVRRRERGSRSFSAVRGDTQALAELGSSSSRSTAWARPGVEEIP